MTWPTSQIAPTSAAGVWNSLCTQAHQAKQNAASARAAAAAGSLTPAALRSLVPSLRAFRQFLNQNDGSADVESYARLCSDPAFALAAESSAVKTALSGAIGAARALYNASLGSMAADGAVTEPLSTIPAADCAPLIAALQALEAAIA